MTPDEIDEVKFTREDLKCLTETCSILGRVEKDQREGFNGINKRIDHLEKMQEDRASELEVRTTERAASLAKVEAEKSAAIYAKIESLAKVENRVERVENDMKLLEGYKNKALGIVVGVQAVIGFLVLFKNWIIIAVMGGGS